MSTKHHQHRSRMTGLVLCGMLAGILIWTKLRLATDVPRSAYAEPRDQTNSQQDAANDDAIPHRSENDRHADRVKHEDN